MPSRRSQFERLTPTWEEDGRAPPFPMFFPIIRPRAGPQGEVAKMIHPRRTRWNWIAATALAAAVSFSIIGCSPTPQQAEAPAAGTNGSVAGTDGPAAGSPGDAPGASSTVALPPGKPAPEFALPSVKGETVKLSDTAGKVRLVAFWSTSCIPCIKELPALKAIYGAQKDRGFEVLYLSADPPELQKPFLAKHQVPFTSLLAENKTLEEYDVSELPKMVLVNGEGRILKEYLGEAKVEALEADVKAALGQAG
jgi:cytochrome c biogenesis protein CcmG, thiol:disulfide interchange protein DsbE